MGGCHTQTATDPNESFFDLDNIDGFIWDTAQGWTTTICRLNSPNFPSVQATWDKTVIDTLDLWSDDRIWRAVEDVDKWIVQMKQFKVIWMEWVQLGKDLVSAIYDFDHLYEPEAAQLAGAKDIDHDHYLASPLGRGLISPTIDAAKEAWITATQQFLEKLSALPPLRYPMTTVDGREEVSDPLKSSEHSKLSELFPEALRRMSFQNSYLPKTTHALCVAVRLKISFLEWVQFSWQDCMSHSRDFRLVCQHLRAVKTFQAGIGPLEDIVMV